MRERDRGRSIATDLRGDVVTRLATPVLGTTRQARRHGLSALAADLGALAADLEAEPLALEPL